MGKATKRTDAICFVSLLMAIVFTLTLTPACGEAAAGSTLVINNTECADGEEVSYAVGERVAVGARGEALGEDAWIGFYEGKLTQEDLSATAALGNFLLAHYDGNDIDLTPYLEAKNDYTLVLFAEAGFGSSVMRIFLEITPKVIRVTTEREPTCSLPGLEKHWYADGTWELVTIPATGEHDYSKHKPNGDGTHNTVCGKCWMAKENDTDDCSYDEGMVTKLPTVTREGIRTRTCTLCGGTDTDPVARLMGTLRLAGKDRFETAFAVADELKAVLGVEKFGSILIACGGNFADALSGSYLAAVKDAPILLVDQYRMERVSEYIRENLKEKGTVYILGGTGSVPAEMESYLKDYTVKRFAGMNRYETNLMILEEAGVADEDILISTGLNFADSLSASSAGKPILLVHSKLTDAQKEFLAGTTGTKYILGGTGSVSEEIQTELMAYGTVERLAGANRYITCISIAEEFFEDPELAVIAYGQNFPDGLCGGVLANKLNAPMLLAADGAGTQFAAEYTEKNNICRGCIFSGAGVLSDESARAIFGTAE